MDLSGQKKNHYKREAERGGAHTPRLDGPHKKAFQKPSESMPTPSASPRQKSVYVLWQTEAM
jgi:hypothetical protein